MDNNKNIRKILFFTITVTAVTFFAGGFYYAQKNPYLLNPGIAKTLELQAKYRANLNNPNPAQTITDPSKVDLTKYFIGDVIAVKDGAVTFKDASVSSDNKNNTSPTEKTIFIDADTKIFGLEENKEYESELKLFVNKGIKEVPQRIKEIVLSAESIVPGVRISGKIKILGEKKIAEKIIIYPRVVSN